jgi:hypothetical protein
VNGPLKKKGNDAFVFPIGKNNRWRRLSITAPTSVSSEFVGEYFDHSYPNLSPLNAPLQAVTNIEYWKLDRLNSTDTIQPSFYWENALASAITTCTQLSIANWNGSSWIDISSAASGNCTGNGAGSIQSNSALNSFGYFTFGFYGNVTTQNITICNGDSISVGANTYTASGAYVDVLNAANSADSTIITQLNVLPALINNQTVTICHGATYSIGGNIYNTQGNYSDTLLSAFGCDSIVNTALYIKTPVNVSVMQNGIILNAANMNGDTYQWIDCDSNYAPMPGEIFQTFIAQANGSYAVIVIENGCSDTSACFSVTSVGIVKNEGKKEFSIYPNPTNGKVSVQRSNGDRAQATLFDINGRIINTQSISGTKAELDYSGEPNGIYFLEINQDGNSVRTKLILH